MPEIIERTLNQTVAANVVRLRRERGWSQPELVRKLNGVVIAGSTNAEDRNGVVIGEVVYGVWTVYKLSDIETARNPDRAAKRAANERRVAVDELAMLAIALNVPLFDLLLPYEEHEHLNFGWGANVGDRNGAALALFHLPGEALSPTRLALFEQQYQHFHTAMMKLAQGLADGSSDWRSVDLSDEELTAWIVFQGSGGMESFEAMWDRNVVMRNEFMASLAEHVEDDDGES